MIWWPQVRSRLVTLFPSLTGWSGVTVYDGEPVGDDDPLVWLTVGYVEGDPTGGQFEKVQDSVDGMLGENGTVRGELVIVTGDVGLPGLQSQAFGLLDAFETYLLANPYIGLLPTASTVFYSADDVPSQLPSGSLFRVPLTFTYFARS